MEKWINDNYRVVVTTTKKKRNIVLKTIYKIKKEK